ncbi:MAG: DUF3828 domain-containing protein [Anaerolineae bacterium]
MKGKLMVGAGLVVAAVIVGLLASGIGPAQATEGVAPEEVVTGFYEWYLGYIGEGERTRNPLVDRSYRSSEFLSEGFVAEVDAVLDSFEGGGYCPFLLAQDVPVSVSVGEAEFSGGEAQVTVELFWGGNPTPSERVVTVRLIDGQWKIAAVNMK